MKIKIIGKKASISSTLTWVFAVFIILFILGIFLFFAFAMTGKRDISNWFDFGSGGGISDNRADVSGTETFITLLSTENNGKSLKKVIFDSLDIYFDTKLDSGQSAVEKLGDINKISEQYSSYQMVKNDRDFVDKARAVLNSVCKRYMLRVPQGIITETAGTLFVPESFYGAPFDARSQIMNENFKDWSTPAILSIPYRNQIIELKFRMLKECA